MSVHKSPSMSRKLVDPDDVQSFGFAPPTPLELAQRRLAFACQYLHSRHLQSDARLDVDVSNRVKSALGALVFPPDFAMKLYEMDRTSPQSKSEHAAQIIARWPEPGHASYGKPNGLHFARGTIHTLCLTLTIEHLRQVNIALSMCGGRLPKISGHPMQLAAGFALSRFSPSLASRHACHSASHEQLTVLECAAGICVRSPSCVWHAVEFRSRSQRSD